MLVAAHWVTVRLCGSRVSPWCDILPDMELGVQPLVRRSLLVVSPLDDGALTDAANSVADAIVLDLASRIPEHQRGDARRATASALGRLSSGGAELLIWTDAKGVSADLAACGRGAIAGVLAAVATPEEVHIIHETLTTWEAANNVLSGATTLELVVATAKAVQNADRLADASPRTVAMVLDDGMLLGELGVATPDTSDRLLYHRGRMAVAARSVGIQAHAFNYAGATTHDRAVAARQAGLRGSLCFNPGDVAVINAGFSPPRHEVDAALQVLDAMQVAIEGGRGAVAVSSGQMADLANVRGANSIIVWDEAVQQRDAAKTMAITPSS